MKHNHHSHIAACRHGSVKYCPACDVAYCVDCQKEWGNCTPCMCPTLYSRGAFDISGDTTFAPTYTPNACSHA